MLLNERARDRGERSALRSRFFRREETRHHSCESREPGFLCLDSGSRPAALPGMTGCHEWPAQVEDFVSEQER